jgi:hypothetical protein
MSKECHSKMVCLYGQLCASFQQSRKFSRKKIREVEISMTQSPNQGSLSPVSPLSRWNIPAHSQKKVQNTSKRRGSDTCASISLKQRGTLHLWTLAHHRNQIQLTYRKLNISSLTVRNVQNLRIEVSRYQQKPVFTAYSRKALLWINLIHQLQEADLPRQGPLTFFFNITIMYQDTKKYLLPSRW